MEVDSKPGLVWMEHTWEKLRSAAAVGGDVQPQPLHQKYADGLNGASAQ